MELKDIEVLIECKRLVEKMLYENKCLVKKLEASGKGNDVTRHSIDAQIIRMERALEGKPPIQFYDSLCNLI